MAADMLTVAWNNHTPTFFYMLSTLRQMEKYTDVTLACDGRFFSVHKLVLASCSDYFVEVFEQTTCKHPVIVLKDIKGTEMEALLNYMYRGVVSVAQEALSKFLSAAEFLQLKGLAAPDELPVSTEVDNTRVCSPSRREIEARPPENAPSVADKPTPGEKTVKIEDTCSDPIVISDDEEEALEPEERKSQDSCMKVPLDECMEEEEDFEVDVVHDNNPQTSAGGLLKDGNNSDVDADIYYSFSDQDVLEFKKFERISLEQAPLELKQLNCLSSEQGILELTQSDCLSPDKDTLKELDCLNSEQDTPKASDGLSSEQGVNESKQSDRVDTLPEEQLRPEMVTSKTSLGRPSPKKDTNAGESRGLDWTKCCFCQTGDSNLLHSSRGYRHLATYLPAFLELGKTTLLPVEELEEVGLFQYLSENQAKYHRCCYTEYSVVKLLSLKRAIERSVEIGNPPSVNRRSKKRKVVEGQKDLRYNPGRKRRYVDISKLICCICNQHDSYQNLKFEGYCKKDKLSAEQLSIIASKNGWCEKSSGLGASKDEPSGERELFYHRTCYYETFPRAENQTE